MFLCLYDFTPSSLSESENRLIKFDIVVLKPCTKNNLAQEKYVKPITQKTPRKNHLSGLGLNPRIVVEGEND